MEDTTQRLARCAVMERSEIRYRRLFEAAQYGIIILDPATRKITEANPFVAQLLGYSHEELLGRELWQIGLLKDEPASQAAFRELQEKGFIRYEDLQLETKGGTKREVEFVSNLYAEDGHTVVQCKIRDITERKRAEEALRALNQELVLNSVRQDKLLDELRESEERFHGMADNIAPLAWMADPTGGISWYNKRWFDYTGTTLAEAQGRGWTKVLHPSHVERVVARVQQSLDTGELWEDTFLLRGKDGAYRWFLSRAFPIRSSDGKISRWFGTNTDITELRETQEALQKTQKQLEEHAANLEKTVAERTASLRETVGELEAFSHSIAHDMRAPLRSMGGYSEIVLGEYAGKLDAQGVDYLQQIVRSSHRLDDLIRDALNYSRVLGGEVKNEPVDLDRLLRDILQTYPDCQPPRAEIQIEGAVPAVLGNEAFLTRCISNLLGNAVKFVAHGKVPRIRIWAEPYGGQLRLCFQDNGIGIASEDHARIFRMFERIHPAMEYEGTGIGLTIARKAVQRMGGDIGFESEPNQGSTFWIQLQSGQP
jgi:PAS domain S-box-containing protein